MRQSALILILTAAIAVMLGLTARELPQNQRSEQAASGNTVDKQLKDILSADNPSDAAAGFSALFKSAKRDQLRRLQTNSSDTIAVQAAWQEVEFTVPENPTDVVRPDQNQLSRFLGFLEGRTRLLTPAWWSEALLDARANRRGNIYAGGVNSLEFRSRNKYAAKEPPVAILEKQAGKSVVRSGSTVAVIPEDLSKTLSDSHQEQVAALITPSTCYVAAFDSVGYPYNLTCVDRASGKVRWTQQVWACSWANATGLHEHRVEIIEQGNRLVVYGVSSIGFYAEAVQIEDGRNVFRFANSYSSW